MKISILYRSCEVNFDEADGKYAGRKLSFDGEGVNDKEFYIYRSLKMYWVSSSPDRPDQYIGTSVANSEKEKLLTYVIAEAKKLGYSLLLY